MHNRSLSLQEGKNAVMLKAAVQKVIAQILHDKDASSSADAGHNASSAHQVGHMRGQNLQQNCGTTYYFFPGPTDCSRA